MRLQCVLAILLLAMRKEIYQPLYRYDDNRIDEDLADVAKGINETATDLAKIQRDDGCLRDCAVTLPSLSREVITLIGRFVLSGQYLAGQPYKKGDVVSYQQRLFLCVEDCTAPNTPDLRFAHFGVESCGCDGKLPDLQPPKEECVKDYIEVDYFDIKFNSAINPTLKLKEHIKDDGMYQVDVRGIRVGAYSMNDGAPKFVEKYVPFKKFSISETEERSKIKGAVADNCCYQIENGEIKGVGIDGGEILIRFSAKIDSKPFLVQVFSQTATFNPREGSETRIGVQLWGNITPSSPMAIQVLIRFTKITMPKVERNGIVFFDSI